MTSVLHPSRALLDLRLSARVDDHLPVLRQQLAACLASGATDLRIDVGGQEDLCLAALQALHGVAEYLHRRGGRLTLVGARPPVLRALALHGFDCLLAPDPAGSDGCRPSPPPLDPGAAVPALDHQEHPR